MSLRQRFNRTHCACPECRACCEHMPGMLAPGDLELILNEIAPGTTTEDDVSAFLRASFVASEGAKVLAAGEIKRVPTIVPRQKEDGSCVFYERGRCMIHPVAPFGCAYLDPHMTREQSDPVVTAALQEIVRDFRQAAELAAGGEIRWQGDHAPGFYAVSFAELYETGYHARPLRERKLALRLALDTITG